MTSQAPGVDSSPRLISPSPPAAKCKSSNHLMTNALQRPILRESKTRPPGKRLHRSKSPDKSAFS